MTEPKRYRYTIYMNEEQAQQLDALRVLVDPEGLATRSALIYATVRWALDHLTGGKEDGKQVINREEGV